MKGVKLSAAGHSALHDAKSPHHAPIASDTFDVIDGVYIGKPEIIFPTDDIETVEADLQAAGVNYEVMTKGWFGWSKR